MYPQAIKEIFSRIYQYEGLSRSDLEKLIAAHETVRVEKNTFLLEEGQIPNEYFILETGLVRAFVHDYKHDEITTNFSSPYNLVIEVASLFQRCPSSENIQALTDCMLWRMPFERFQELFHEIKSFSEWGRAWMSESLFRFKQRSVEMISLSATDRYLKLLRENPQVIQLAPLKYIATYLGITDSSLSRIRKELAKAGEIN